MSVPPSKRPPLSKEQPARKGRPDPDSTSEAASDAAELPFARTALSHSAPDFGRPDPGAHNRRQPEAAELRDAMNAALERAKAEKAESASSAERRTSESRRSPSAAQLPKPGSVSTPTATPTGPRPWGPTVKRIAVRSAQVGGVLLLLTAA